MHIVNNPFILIVKEFKRFSSRNPYGHLQDEDPKRVSRVHSIVVSNVRSKVYSESVCEYQAILPSTLLQQIREERHLFFRQYFWRQYFKLDQQVTLTAFSMNPFAFDHFLVHILNDISWTAF